MNDNISEFSEDADVIDTSSVILDAELSRFSRELLTFAAIVTVLIMIAGIIGNLLTILALIRCPRIRNVASAFIMSLCISDFIFCLLVLPFSSSRFIHGAWIHGPVLCTLFPFLRYGSVGVSLLSIAMITINRYVMIAHYCVYSTIYRPIIIGVMIAFCWCLSYGMQLPTLFGVWGKFGQDLKLGTCSIVPDENGRSAKTALFIIAFVIPCVVICCCYARIFLVVRSSELRIRKHATAQFATADNTNNIRKEESKLLKARRNEWRITQMVLVIFLSYLACYLPITIVKVTDSEVRYPGVPEVSYPFLILSLNPLIGFLHFIPLVSLSGLHVTGYILLYFSACVNPIIYVIMNSQYRQAYKTVLFCKKVRVRSSTHYNQSSVADKSKDVFNKTVLTQVPIVLNNLGK